MAERNARPHCRVCRLPLGREPLLTFTGMPRAAQGFPTAETLTHDRAEDLVLSQCVGCGLVQIAGRPVSYFRDVIRAAAFSDEMRGFRQRQFRDWAIRHELIGEPVLEVGCGRGEYLALLRDAGLSVHGVEHSRGAVDACRAAGLPVSRLFLDREGQAVPEAPFAAFTSFNFMEHWPSPVRTLRAIHGNLRQGALGLVEVPNFDMILEKEIYSEFIRDHLSYFTRSTLAFALQAAGFEVLGCESIWHDYILSATVRRREPMDLAAQLARRELVTQSLRQFLDRFAPSSVAIWGAGHQALATIALTGIAPAIRYVVDSAPFKQGKFTPATHLPIVSPERLRTDPVRAVIVMAAGYSDEIVRALRRDHAAATIAVLREHGLEPA